MKIVLALLLALLLSYAKILACGVDLPPSYIYDADAYEAHFPFENELNLVFSEFYAINTDYLKSGEKNVIKADLFDFRDCVRKQKFNQKYKEKLIRQFLDYRLYPKLQSEKELSFIPDNLKEFRLYLAGVKEMHKLKKTKIPAAWLQLLRLKPSERKYRTTWTLYMIGNLFKNCQNKKAVRYYKFVREAIDDGYIDSLGLAPTSFRHEFSCHNDPVEKMVCALMAFRYYNKKDKRAFIRIIRKSCDISKYNKVELQRLVAHPVCREMLAAQMISKKLLPGEQYDKLVNLFDKHNFKYSERFAYVAFQNGMLKTTLKILKTIPEDSILKYWLLAQIARSRGDYPKTAKYLRKWLKYYKKYSVNIDEYYIQVKSPYSYYYKSTFPKMINGQLGTLLVYEKDFLEALHCFMEAESWPDAAFVAERLVPVDMLKKYVNTHCRNVYQSEQPQFYNNFENFLGTNSDLKYQLRYLLGRRLMRAGRYSEALEHLPPSTKKHASLFILFLRNSQNPNLAENDRALNLYNAGKIMRWFGMSMCATSLYPDSFDYRGNYGNSEFPPWICSSETGIKKIINHSFPKPNLQHHYRYTASELMWKAASLCGDKKFRATALFVGGSWLKNKSPQHADKFYKKLARIRGLHLAEVADKKRWFPRDIFPSLDAEVANSNPVLFEQVIQLPETYKKQKN